MRLDSNFRQWDQDGRRLASELATELDASIEAEYLNDALLEFRLAFGAGRGPSVKIIVSPRDVIVAAGRRTQQEFGALPASEQSVAECVRSFVRECS
jgi:hypothetical protein